jgi:death-on-curing protein
MLDLCVNRPRQSAGQQDIYKTLEEKAAALTEAIINVHPFVDANKRTGIMSGMSMLLVNGRTPIASAEDLYSLAIEVENGLLTQEGLAEWMSDPSNVLPLTPDEIVANPQLFDPDVWELGELEI